MSLNLNILVFFHCFCIFITIEWDRMILSNDQEEH